MTKDIDDRMKLSFEQAEGAAPLPSQLQLREISRELRAVLWDAVHDHLNGAINYVSYGDNYVGEPWSIILKAEHVFRQHKMTDDFNTDPEHIIRQVRSIFEDGNYLAVFGWLEFVLKHRSCPPDFAAEIDEILRYCSAAYRVIDRHVISPISSDTEHETIVKAFADLAAAQFNGARAHLRSAASHLTAGAYADSVRESIHAVEAVGRTLDPSANTLNKALARLEQKISIHPAMKSGFVSLYAYTSDEQGIRHALLDDSVAAKVDETDALFMLGTCAAFVSYLVNKVRASGLLP